MYDDVKFCIRDIFLFRFISYGIAGFLSHEPMFRLFSPEFFGFVRSKCLCSYYFLCGSPFCTGHFFFQLFRFRQNRILLFAVSYLFSNLNVTTSILSVYIRRSSLFFVQVFPQNYAFLFFNFSSQFSVFTIMMSFPVEVFIV